MNINESIWGAESTWRNALVTPVTVDEYDEASQKLKALEMAKVKISTENFTIADGLENQVLDKTEDFDNSVSFWNVGADANTKPPPAACGWNAESIITLIACPI